MWQNNNTLTVDSPDSPAYRVDADQYKRALLDQSGLVTAVTVVHYEVHLVHKQHDDRHTEGGHQANEHLLYNSNSCSRLTHKTNGIEIVTGKA